MIFDTTAHRLRLGAAALAFSLPLAAAPAYAQEQQTDSQTTEQTSGDQAVQTAQQNQTGTTAGDAASETQTAQPQTGATDQNATGQAAAGAGMQDDLLIANVNDREIRRSDVVAAIRSLPPQVQQMPAEMLIPAVVDQLIVTGLIVEQARSENLQEDPEVVALVEPNTAAVEDQALVQIWLQRALDERVTDEAVQQAYSDLQSQNPDMTLSLDQVRPQIEENLRQQAMSDIRTELQQDAQITLYGPTGEPLTPDQSQTGATTGDQETEDGGAAGAAGSNATPQ